MTIVKTSAQLQHYPFHRFEEDARALFSYASKKLPETAYTQGIEALWKAMECYLAVTSQTLHLAVMKAPGSQQLFQGFVGALAGDELIGWSRATRGNHTRTFVLLVKVLAQEGKTAANDFKDAAK